MPVAAVDETVVDLVADHEQVVALGDLGDRPQLLLGEDRTGRIAWVAQEEDLGPRGDRGFRLGWVELETVSALRRDQDGDPRRSGTIDGRYATYEGS